MPPKKKKTETPEEHVHASTGRQAAAAKNVAATAKKVARTASDKAAVLATATEMLSSRVATLADVVQTNNQKIDQLQREVNTKPDDTEVQFIAGLAIDQRRQHLRYAVVTALLSGLVAGLISWSYAYQGIKDRTEKANVACVRNNIRADIDARVFDDVRNIIPPGPVADRLTTAADELRKTTADCDALHPIKK